MSHCHFRCEDLFLLHVKLEDHGQPALIQQLWGSMVALHLLSAAKVCCIHSLPRSPGTYQLVNFQNIIQR